MRLKWGQTEYTGRLVSIDSYMNIQLSNAEEFVDGKSTGSLGQVLIRWVASVRCQMENMLTGCRCNNVLWVSARNKDKANGDTNMEG